MVHYCKKIVCLDLNVYRSTIRRDSIFDLWRHYVGPVSVNGTLHYMHTPCFIFGLLWVIHEISADGHIWTLLLTYLICMYVKTLFQGTGYSGRVITKLCTDFLDGIWELKSTTWSNIRAIFKMCDTYYIYIYIAIFMSLTFVYRNI